MAHILQNAQIDHITSNIDSWHFSNEFIKNVFTISYDYLTGVGKGVVNFNSVLDILTQKNKARPDNINYLKGLHTKPLNSFPALDYVIENIKSMAIRRRLILITNRSLQAAMNEGEDVHKSLIDLEDDLFSIEKRIGALEVFMGTQILTRRYEGIDARYKSKGVYTGWPHLDQRLSVGFAPGKMSIIAGRTSMGKSLYKTNVIINQCKQGVGVLNICPEQGFDSEHDRIDAVLSGVHLRAISRLREWPRNDEKFQLLKNSTIQTCGWNYACVPTRDITLAGIRTAIRRVKRMGMPVDIVYIDLFDRLQDVNVAKDRTGTISVKLNELLRVGEEEQVHFAPLVQVNRSPEGRRDKRPTLGDLRDCGNYEQDADNVFLLFREGYYDDTLDDNVLDVTIAKQRDGVRGVTIQFLIMDKQTLAISPIGEKRIVTGD